MVIDQERVNNRILRMEPITLHKPQKVIAWAVQFAHAGLVFALCGRRFGKTYLAAQIAAHAFMTRGENVLYVAPSLRQADVFWREVDRRVKPYDELGLLDINKQRRIVTPLPYAGLPERAMINAVTGRDPEILRGGWGNLLILDEFQHQHEDLFEDVIQPMRIDEGGKVLFLLTPPNVKKRSWDRTGNKNPLHARDLVFKLKGLDPNGQPLRDQQTGEFLGPDEDALFFNFPTQANPHAKREVLKKLRRQMSVLSWRQEVMAQLVGDNPEAMWKRELIEHLPVPPLREFSRIVIGVDPAGRGYSETGIVVAGLHHSGKLWVLADESGEWTPDQWAMRVIRAFTRWQADRVIAEGNYGGPLVEDVIGTRAKLLVQEGKLDYAPPVTIVHAMRGKELRADPVVALYEQGEVYHNPRGLTLLEDQMCLWVPGSGLRVDRVDAMVWCATHLGLTASDGFWLYTPGDTLYSDGIGDDDDDPFDFLDAAAESRL